MTISVESQCEMTITIRTITTADAQQYHYLFHLIPYCHIFSRFYADLIVIQ